MNFRQKRLTITKEKKLERQHYIIAIGLMIFYVTYYFFFEPKVIGDDRRYIVYIFLLPTLLGFLLLAIYRIQFLTHKFSTNRGIILWTFMTLFYSAQGLIFSYLSFGQVAKISWDIVNYRTAKLNVEEVIGCKITRFWTGTRSNNIDFLFNERHHKLNVRYRDIEDYLDTNVNDYYLEITARKGIWNYYLVERWNIKARKEH